MDITGKLKSVKELVTEFPYRTNNNGDLVIMVDGDNDFVLRPAIILAIAEGKSVTIKNAVASFEYLFEKVEKLETEEQPKTYKLKLKDLYLVLMAYDYKFTDTHLILVMPDGEYLFPLKFLKTFGNAIEVRKGENDSLVTIEEEVKIPTFIIDSLISSSVNPTLDFVARLMKVI